MSGRKFLDFNTNRKFA